MSLRVRWDAEAMAILDAVNARRLPPAQRRVEWARGLGVDAVTDEMVRKAYKRCGRTISFMAHAPRTALTHGDEQRKSADVEPETQRSERVPTQPSVTGGEPVEAPCRAFVAPREPAPIGESDHERVLVIPDVHIPTNSIAATDLALAIGMALRPTAIVVLGDVLDFAPLSFHQRTRKIHSLRAEVDGGRAFFRALEQLGAKTRILCLGNHEFRLDRYIHGHAPALADLDGMSVDEMLHLSANGWRVVPYHDGIRLGGVYYTHEVGHCGMHAVRTSGERMASPIVIGHVHSLTGSEMHSFDGESRGAWSFGWLGDFDSIDYRHRAKAFREWPHAVGVVYGDEQKNAWAQPIVMRDRSRVAMLHGKSVRA